MFRYNAELDGAAAHRRGLRWAGAAVLVAAAVAGAAAPPALAHGAASEAVDRMGQATQAPKPADPSHQPYVDADVQFMSGMIPHHAQAVKISGWCASHGARADLQVLCARMIVEQSDEITLMQNWLRDRKQVVPEATATHMKMNMGGMEHDMLMPGMLTDEQLAELDTSRGRQFDQLFLNAMIRHHQGAISMVDTLNASYGAVQDDVIFKFSSDVVADQTTEIERMQRMLESPSGGSTPQ